MKNIKDLTVKVTYSVGLGDLEMPIQIQLSKSDKNNIANMHEDKFNYICFPDGMKWEEVENKLNFKTPIDGGSSLETLT